MGYALKDIAKRFAIAKKYLWHFTLYRVLKDNNRSRLRKNICDIFLITSRLLLELQIKDANEQRTICLLRGCLHEKTRTGASFIPRWPFCFVSCLHYDWVISYLVIWRTLKHVRFKIANITHALPVPVYQQTDFTPDRVVVSHLHETVASDSRRHDILWWYHVNKFRAMGGNRSELTPERKSSRCHVNTPW